MFSDGRNTPVRPLGGRRLLVGKCVVRLLHEHLASARSYYRVTSLTRRINHLGPYNLPTGVPRSYENAQPPRTLGMVLL